VTEQKIISLAKDCGFDKYYGTDSPEFLDMLVAFYHISQREAFEQAAHTCERLISGDGICASDEVWIHDCAEAIRQLIKE